MCNTMYLTQHSLSHLGIIINGPMHRSYWSKVLGALTEVVLSLSNREVPLSQIHLHEGLSFYGAVGGGSWL